MTGRTRVAERDPDTIKHDIDKARDRLAAEGLVVRRIHILADLVKEQFAGMATLAPR